MSNPSTSLPPGFRFHPTDEELILHYLKKKAASTPCPVSIIAEVDIYKFDPWDLPAKAAFGEKEWYFFSPRDRKYPNGARPNRAAGSGYWKATGTDKMITATTMMRGKKENIGVKKALVFYKGRPPKGLKTSWIMHEYRLADALNAFKRPSKSKDSSMRLDDWVLCRIYMKSHPLPTMAATDKEQEDTFTNEISLPSTTNQNNLQLHKSSSFSDLLAAADFSLLTRFLLENPSDSSASELSSIFSNTSFNQPTNNSSSSSSNSYLFPKLPQQEMSMVAFENQLKRQRSAAPPLMMDEGVLHPSKKINSSCTFTNITNQLLDTPQYNLLNPNQSLFNQHLLLNSHLEFQ